MRCPSCDHELKPDTKICPKCGTNITDSSAILGQKPTVSYTKSSGSLGGGSSGLAGFIKVWATIMLILCLIGTVYAAFKFGRTEVPKGYYSYEKVFNGKVFFPILLGGIIACIDHYLILFGIGSMLDKIDGISSHVWRR